VGKAEDGVTELVPICGDCEKLLSTGVEVKTVARFAACAICIEARQCSLVKNTDLFPSSEAIEKRIREAIAESPWKKNLFRLFQPD
jgi:hypothetical protein